VSRLTRALWKLEARLRLADSRVAERKRVVRADIGELERDEVIRKGPWLRG
jgi:hypothetical protein